MRLPLTGLLGCGLLRVFQAVSRLSPFFCVFCSFTVSLFFLYPFLCRLSFCLSLALHVSVLFSSCVISPVSLFLVSDTRVSCMPRPGCQTCRDPGVRRAETRVSDVPRPGCRTCQDPGVIQYPSVSPCFLSAFRCFFPRACAYIIMCPFCLAFHPP